MDRRRRAPPIAASGQALQGCKARDLACHAKEIIAQAFARFGVPAIINTDQGSQFTAEEFT